MTSAGSTTHAPPRLAYSPGEAARTIGCSRDFFDEHIAPELKWVRRGRRKFVSVKELEAWFVRSGELTLPSRAA
jgi:hypothetical protein